MLQVTGGAEGASAVTTSAQTAASKSLGSEQGREARAQQARAAGACLRPLVGGQREGINNLPRSPWDATPKARPTLLREPGPHAPSGVRVGCGGSTAHWLSACLLSARQEGTGLRGDSRVLRDLEKGGTFPHLGTIPGLR